MEQSKKLAMNPYLPLFSKGRLFDLLEIQRYGKSSPDGNRVHLNLI